MNLIFRTSGSFDNTERQFSVIQRDEFEFAHELEVMRMIDIEVVHVLLYTKWK